MRELRVGFLQQHNTADTKDNMLRLGEGITDLAKRGAKLIVLQELHNTLYFWAWLLLPHFSRSVRQDCITTQL